MILIDEIHIEEFRGIRSLDLKPAGKSYAVWGPNGSGKSGVVDAIDFALTGNVSRLSGEGTGTISLRLHGPHVVAQDAPDAAKVTLAIRDVATGKAVRLTRRVRKPNAFVLEPDTPQMRAVVDEMREHPDIILSRREIIKFILTKPGDRNQQLQALLKIDRFDQVRKLLQTARTQAEKDQKNKDRDLTAAQDAIKTHLGVGDTAESLVAAVINERREVLGLDVLSQITLETDLASGLTARNSGSGISKPTALREVEGLQNMLAGQAPLSAVTRQLAQALGELSADPGILLALRHRSLLEGGIALATEASCPLCDVPWESVEALASHLRDKLARCQAAADLEKRIKSASAAVVDQLRAVTDMAARVQRWAESCGHAEFQHQLELWSRNLAELCGAIGTPEEALELLPRVSGDILRAPAEVTSGLTAIHGTLEAIPDQMAAMAAHTFLAVAQERWGRLSLASRAARASAATRRVAVLVYDTYGAVADAALSDLYANIQDDFGSYYRQINSDDESSFTAQLLPSQGKLDLTVDFHGYGQHPPAAYHSEGHQDGMGVCLYLALMNRTLGPDFRLAVLDDVVMSVDQDHRRQFCELLKSEFPGVQFIITTHDEVWARQMRSSGLIAQKSQAQFRGWSVDDGPVYEPDCDIWSRIDADLASNDVPGAAHKLRRHLEFAMGELAASLRARVCYKADHSYDLGELQSAVSQRHGDLLGKALKSARAWENDEARQQVESLQAQRTKALSEQTNENWAINKLVHYNDWASMTANDFRPVIDASREFLALFTCANEDCTGWIYAEGQGASAGTLRCKCGTYNLNLLVK